MIDAYSSLWMVVIALLSLTIFDMLFLTSCDFLLKLFKAPLSRSDPVLSYYHRVSGVVFAMVASSSQFGTLLTFYIKLIMPQSFVTFLCSYPQSVVILAQLVLLLTCYQIWSARYSTAHKENSVVEI